ncbi:MAG: hypothetical protein ACN6I4_00040 [bacterium]
MNKEKEQEEKPPILGTWRNVYTLVIGTLVVLILLFYLFTQYYK